MGAAGVRASMAHGHSRRAASPRLPSGGRKRKGRSRGPTQRPGCAIEDTLNGAKYKRYRHAARHMLECQALDPNIEDYAAFEAHDAFVNRIRAKHSRKISFWSHVAEFTASAGARPHI
jgi:Family of unknown function (DUF6880)